MNRDSTTPIAFGRRLSFKQVAALTSWASRMNSFDGKANTSRNNSKASDTLRLDSIMEKGENITNNNSYQNEDDVFESMFGLSKKATKIKAVESEIKKKQDNDNDLENNELGFSDLPWGGRWLGFAGTVSIVGLKYAVDAASSNSRRLIWGFLVLSGIIFLTFQIYER